MPAKYRRMADFHEYYSGARKAPCLTVFVGGNHEASNYLYELYYGGWVAPNMFYMGAANVLRFGPLRIAGLSGIFKGYHYHKPHFERLPYNNSDYYGIYHVRDLDVRKLLNVRTQVDVGISHDWPRGVEWNGNHAKLFHKKAHLRPDAEAGRLGSPAAKSCLDRLRPAHWFSAHLHTKYPAVVHYGLHDKIPTQMPRGDVTSPPLPNVSQEPKSSRVAHRNASRNDADAISAWNTFSTVAPKVEAEEANRLRQEQQERWEEEERTGVRNLPSYTFNETWKQVETNGELDRRLNTVTKAEVRSEDIKPIQQLDGAACSSINPFKRKHGPDLQSEEEGIVPKSPKTSSEFHRATGVTPMIEDLALHGNGMASSRNDMGSRKNENEIDIDFSGSEEGLPAPGPQDLPRDAQETSLENNDPSLPAADIATSPNDIMDKKENKQTLTPINTANTDQVISWQQAQSAGNDPLPEQKLQTANDSSTVADDVRAQLASISSTFAPVQTPSTSTSLPFPAAISNTTTHFLALDKCETRRQFLELVEISPVSDQDGSMKMPFELAYDKEWLAITRAFANELELGGSPDDRCPPNLGEAIYRERIEREETWVDENIMQKGLMIVPNNFTMTAPAYDPQGETSPDRMPREFPNPQTDAFCALVGIENKFAISDQEIDERILRGARSETTQNRQFKKGGRGQGHGGGRGGFRGGGHRGGRGGRRGGRSR